MRAGRGNQGTGVLTTTISLVSILAAAPVLAQDDPPGGAPADARRAKTEAILRSIKWDSGPTKVNVGDNAEIEVPEGHLFTGPTGTRKMLELMENPTSGTELGLLTPKTMSWFLVFEFSALGYVKDADKEELDGEEILGSIRQGTERSNEQRKKRGWPTIRIVGWQTAPFFDQQTKHLKWCIEGESRGRSIVNYNTRILGREGVMSANLMVAPDKLQQAISAVKTLLGSFAYKEGQRYAEYKPGDKIAEYGLTALVVGGAVGVAAKVGLLAKLLGFLAKLWKLLLVGLFAVGAGIKALFFRRRREPEVGPGDDDDRSPPSGDEVAGGRSAEAPEPPGPANP